MRLSKSNTIVKLFKWCALIIPFFLYVRFSVLSSKELNSILVYSPFSSEEVPVHSDAKKEKVVDFAIAGM